ncbi:MULTISPECIES: anthranilate synthase component I family protein [Kitasatospora]|uniref:Putative p-aminobenzoate synthase n=1 Tax=Kitasatospora setae (strain ATCC 33774 / DSM 43861 / JCM 3304 / KCC A-0304 / NBRC 14216 / KM-6054) TaxID=452652 RepID=E4NIM6_KITSK|nr:MULTISPECIES: anthranilate synthase component I family protein [Kitasatospora]BAJ32824.1 putative p-aminobenzoate synthase [Kitasatospora setae KM-6054]
MTELLDVTVTAISVETTARALEVRAELCRILGPEEVFLLDDLHPDRSHAGTGTVVGFGRLAEISVTGDRVTVRGSGPVADLLRARCGRTTTDPWAMLRRVTALFRVHTDVRGFSFGFLTTVGYDAAAYMEELPPRQVEPDVPDLTLTLFQDTLWFGRQDGPPVLLRASGPGLPEPLPLGLLRGIPDADLPVPDAPAPLEVRDTVDRETFLGWVERCLDRIRVGDIYQIQVGHRIDVRSALTPEEVYRRLSARNPSPYMYLLTQSGTTLVGASPELLFRLDDGLITMRPIAGTTRRDPTGADNARRVAELRADVKERAEHVMLVDLSRNDVGRVCRPGTLAVTDLMKVEEFSHVFHLVSTVTGTLDAGRDVWDVLCATFPAGTMTGAPKLRAMEIIDEIEIERRGLYAGAVGLVDVRGWAEFALCIRTVTHREPSPGDHRYATQSCAGVVALSEPKREWDETLAKMGAAHWALTGKELA